MTEALRADEFDLMLSTLRYVLGAGQAKNGEKARDHYNAIINSIANRAERTEDADVRLACAAVKRAALAQPTAPTAQQCTCPSGDGSLRWPCPQHPANIAQPVQQPGAEPDMRHPKIQALIGSKARCQIELMLVEQLIEDPDCDLTSMDMEYWGPMHDRLKEALTKAAPAQRQPLTAEAVFASKDFMSMNGLYWGLGIETLMQIVRVTERECAAAWGVTLAQKGEKL